MAEENTYEETEIEQQQTSKFNSASAQLSRIDDLFKTAHIYSLDAEYKKWRFTCDRIWMEMAAEATEEQKVYQSNVIEILTKIYSKYKTLNKEELSKLNTKQLSEYKILESKMMSNRDAMLYHAITQYEIFLRNCLNKQGKGSVYKPVKYGGIK